jgi:heat shock protein HslJ
VAASPPRASKLAILAMALVASACSSPTDKPLESTRWLLKELEGKPLLDAAQDGPDRPFLMLSVTDHRAAGSTGCNQFTGNYEREGSKLKFLPLAATRRFCEATAAVEQGFLRALAATDAYRVTGTKLELIGGGKVLAGLEARTPVE